MANSVTTPATPFNPFNQSITLLTSNGTSIQPIDIPMSDFVKNWYINMSLGLTYGAEIGLASLMLLTLLLLTAPGKRTTPIYLLNVSSLVLDIIRSVLMAVWLTSHWNHPVTLFTADFSNITHSDIATSSATDAIRTLELGTILTSLLFQVHVILSTTTTKQRAVVLGIAFVLATLTVSVQLATAVVNIRNIMDMATMDYLGLQERLADLTRVMMLVTTTFFLLVFVSKLGVAIRRKVRLQGQRSGGIGPMQCVMVGSLQSCVVPVLVTAAPYWGALGDFSSLALTTLVIQLPLTALWASTSIEGRLVTPSAKQAPFIRPSPIVVKPQDASTGSASKGKSALLMSQTSLGSEQSVEKDKYRLDTLPMMTTMGSLDVEVKMDERDMV